MNRRSFLKALCAAAGVAAVPDLGVPISVPEPIWRIAEDDYGEQLGVAAQWMVGDKKLRYAVRMPMPTEEDREESIELAKQILRQWYSERSYG